MIENILKSSLFPILTDTCYALAKEIWQNNRFASIILFITGFIFTKIGNLIIIAIILLIIYRKKIFI